MSGNKVIPLFLLSIVFPFSAIASLPSVSFSGSSGATVGAGSIVGWERNGFGINPAAIHPRSMSFSVSGYSPYGLDGIDVGEITGSWDGAHTGTSLTYLGMYDAEGGSVSAYQLQESISLMRGLTTGLSVRYQSEEDRGSFDGGAGILWKMFSFLAVGGIVETVPTPWGHSLKSAIGADVGGALYGAYAWRVCVENNYNLAEGTSWRYGADFQLHSLLSLYGGWSPGNQTMALGIRFGMGNLEGFSALRHHLTLGTTAIQGLRWERKFDP